MCVYEVMHSHPHTHSPTQAHVDIEIAPRVVDLHVFPNAGVLTVITPFVF